MGKKDKDELKAIIASNEAELALTLETKDMVNEAIWLLLPTMNLP